MYPRQLRFKQRAFGLARLAFFAAILALIGVAAAPVSAQQPEIDTAFSDAIIDTLGYPEIAIEVGPDGVTAPSSLTAGLYLVTLTAAEPYVAYLDFMQPPAGLSEEEEIELAPGEYQIAASYYLLEEGSEEVMRLVPLTVTASATPAATPVSEPPATVTLEETDGLRYVVSPDPVPAGPQLWKITNTGEMHAHHVVMWRIPDGITADDIVADFTSLMSGTPPAGPPLIAQFVHVGYAALQSGGQTTWVEFDLTPGTYAVICFIVDPHTGRPHVLDGMATVFAVR